jgi:hypothetical protein
MLTPEQFERLIEGGFGNPGSTLAHSMAAFNGHIYVGTSAPSTKSPDDRARVLRFDPDASTWEIVWESPVFKMDERIKSRSTWLSTGGGGGRRRQETEVEKLGRDFGLRSMAVFQGKSDKAPCLYVGTMSIWGGMILRSEDGLAFEPVSAPGLGDDTVMSFRALTILGDKIFVAPVGTITEDRIDRNLAPSALIYVTDDPAKGNWQVANIPDFDDPANEGVFSMTAAHGYVYAGTGSPTRGFQLWRTDGKGEAPFEWERVLTDGGFRFNHSLSTGAMAEFNGDLYVGSGIPGFGVDIDNDVGPSAAELLRVRPDKSWDLIMGEPRFTPDGLKIPLSAMAPGFDNPYNSVIWAMTTHNGTLYAGTHNWEPNAWAQDRSAKSIKGGYELWASEDGDSWTKVMDQGGGNSMGCGVRTLLSTKHGLFVGTLNHTKLIKFQAKVRGNADIVGDEPVGFEVWRGA